MFAPTQNLYLFYPDPVPDHARPHLKYLSSLSSWEVFSHPGYPGLFVVKGAFSPSGLSGLLSRVLLKYPAGLGLSKDSGDQVRFFKIMYLPN